MKKIESLLELLTDTAKAYKNISSNFEDLRHAEQPIFTELITHLEEQILQHTVDKETSPPLLDLQQSFIPVITAAVQVPEIDIPSLISTQHGLSQAYVDYQKLEEIFSISI